MSNYLPHFAEAQRRHKLVAEYFFLLNTITNSHNSNLTNIVSPRFPATELRLVNAFAWLAERMSANSTKNFERAGITFIPLLIIAFQILFKNAVGF
jgi:hypothetical protein